MALRRSRGLPAARRRPGPRRPGRRRKRPGGAEGSPAQPNPQLPDYEVQLAAKEAEIEALQAKVAEAAKTSEAMKDLNSQIAALKQQMADERVGFALISAGTRNVKATRALLGDPTTTWPP